MTTKSTITGASTGDMKSGDLYIAEKTGIVVMVTAAPMNPRAAKEFAGIVLHSGTEQDIYSVGFHDDGWVVEAFKPFNGILTLESTP